MMRSTSYPLRLPLSGILAVTLAGLLSAAAAPAAVEPAAGKHGDKKLRKGTRGTEMSEDFE